MLHISITKYHRLLNFSGLLLVAFREKIDTNNGMNALYATQTMNIYDVIAIHIHVSFKQSLTSF